MKQIILFYIYVLKSKKDNQGYIGSTNDLKRRFEEHNLGLVFSTKPRRPFELVYYEAYKAEKDARLKESKLKLKSRAYEQLRKRIANSLSDIGFRIEILSKIKYHSTIPT